MKCFWKNRGFSLIEALVAMVILGGLFVLLLPLTMLQRKVDGKDNSSMACIKTDNGNWTAQSCIKAIDNCKYERNNSCNTLKLFAENGNTQEKAAAEQILRKSCDQGGENACKFFAQRCKANLSNCDIVSSDNDLVYYLNLPLNDSNIGKMEVYEATKYYYDNAVTNIVTKVNEICCNPGVNLACAVKNVDTCP